MQSTHLPTKWAPTSPAQSAYLSGRILYFHRTLNECPRVKQRAFSISPFESVSLCSNLKTSMGFYFNLAHMRHLTTWLVFPLSREMISWLRIKPPTTPFSLGTSPLSLGSLGPSWTILQWVHTTNTQRFQIKRCPIFVELLVCWFVASSY